MLINYFFETLKLVEFVIILQTVKNALFFMLSYSQKCWLNSKCDEETNSLTLKSVTLFSLICEIEINKQP
jgi:hypothetical protein